MLNQTAAIYLVAGARRSQARGQELDAREFRPMQKGDDQQQQVASYILPPCRCDVYLQLFQHLDLLRKCKGTNSPVWAACTCKPHLGCPKRGMVELSATLVEPVRT